jgi:GH24 family phage-related lysozyme (muramidase)
MKELYLILSIICLTGMVEGAEYLYHNSTYYKDKQEIENFRKEEAHADSEKSAILLKQIEKEAEKIKLAYFKEMKAEFELEQKNLEEYKLALTRNQDIKETICSFEGKILTQYNDVGNIKTISCGLTGVKSVSLTEQEHVLLLDNVVNRHIKELKSLNIPYDQHKRNQQIAMILALHQLGLTMFRKEPYIKCLKKVNSCAISELKKLWGNKGYAKYALFYDINGRRIKVASVESKSLRIRRQKEVEIFINQNYKLS